VHARKLVAAMLEKEAGTSANKNSISVRETQHETRRETQEQTL
jgi:hypothetical protein